MKKIEKSFGWRRKPLIFRLFLKRDESGGHIVVVPRGAGGEVNDITDPEPGDESEIAEAPGGKARWPEDVERMVAGGFEAEVVSFFGARDRDGGRAGKLLEIAVDVDLCIRRVGNNAHLLATTVNERAA